jgi:Asp-tRNA(Asn)/Glu-tRNA(Gln) amidotransferase A subunit family amidase
MKDITFLSAHTMAEFVRQKKISPVELVEAHLAKIERLNPGLNAFIELDSVRARQSAREAETAVMREDPVGPLHGVPVSIKSSISVAGLRWEAGTLLRHGLAADYDATLVSRLRNAGAIILGTTNAPELLMAWETDNLLYGRTSNPWDVSCTAGGSSGGEAAAIAAGMSAAGVGSDGGGSIRVPAHFTGICGLKPTPGRIPSTGHYPVSAGPFALLGVVGPLAEDCCSAPVALRWANSDQTKQLKIGYFEDDDRTPVTSETRAVIRTAAEALRNVGFHVEPFRPDVLEEARQLWHKFFVVAGGMLLRPMFRGRESELSPMLRQFLKWSVAESPLTGKALLEAWIGRDTVRAKCFAQMQRKDLSIVICPAAAIPAFRHGERSWMIEEKSVHYLDAWSYTEFFNLLGNPAAVVPVGQSREGLPIGVQVVGRPWEEEQVLSVAEILEKQCGAWRIPPHS